MTISLDARAARGVRFSTAQGRIYGYSPRRFTAKSRAFYIQQRHHPMAHDPSYILQNLGGAKDPKGGNRASFPLTGNHQFAIVKVFTKDIKAFGLSVAVSLHCVKSDNPSMVVGNLYEVLFRTSMNSPRGFERDEEYARMKFFMNATTGHPLSDAARAQATAASFLGAAQPGRGFIVACKGYTNGKSDFVNYDWSNVPGQSGETIKGVRAKLDEKYPNIVDAAKAAPAPAPAAAPVESPAPAGALDLSSLGL